MRYVFVVINLALATWLVVRYFQADELNYAMSQRLSALEKSFAEMEAEEGRSIKEINHWIRVLRSGNDGMSDSVSIAFLEVQELGKNYWIFRVSMEDEIEVLKSRNDATMSNTKTLLIGMIALTVLNITVCLVFMFRISRRENVRAN